ncbi:MAG: 4-alpha-glucanotransferase [Deltaproteobacteria bacterium]|nr:MAG: 4-alpha-glucanotransferase [Deltaproteobacteria bacterium]
MYSIATRTAGLLVPLFALRSERDWGIGEIGDLAAYCQWLGSAGHRFLQLLPIFEMPAGERSPYGALSTFAVDPIYLSLGEVEDFLEAGGEAMLPGPERAALDAARVETGIDYDRVRTVKRRALEIAFARFDLREWSTGSSRAARLRDFAAAEADWLADYALFRACQERQAGASWTEWEPALRSRAPEVLAHARQTFDRDLRFHTYVQWLASEQWTAARRAASAAGVALAGDLPFMVGRESADVWSRQEEFQLDTELGAPPDAFNAEGQRWGLPVPRWETMARGDFGWLRARSRRAAALFDAVRIDHVVGFYRIYRFPTTGAPEFVPPDEGEQLALGERLLTVALASAAGTALMGEDLGVVPDFVRASLVRLAIPGYRVLRWEDDAGVFRDPSAYPPLSVATSGTHDTSSLATWWSEELDPAARRALAAVPAFGGLRDADAIFTPAVHAALLDGLYGAASSLVMVPVQDAYGGRERINVPATVGRRNWDFRLPWTARELAGPATADLRERLHALARRHGRSPSALERA